MSSVKSLTPPAFLLCIVYILYNIIYIKNIIKRGHRAGQEPRGRVLDTPRRESWRKVP
jgi:hypothetical protein